MTQKRKDPRVELVVKIMEDTRFERAKRMLTVRDMRRNDGRVRMADEAKAIIKALDDYDAAQFDKAIDADRAALKAAEA